MKRPVFFFILLFFSSGFIFSVDLGLHLNNKIEGENNIFTYNPSLTPWFSFNNDKGFSLYLSLLLSFKYIRTSGNGSWRNPEVLIPELTRFSANYRTDKGFFIEIGRIEYSDVLGFAASELFDGVSAGFATPKGNLRFSAYYTGFQYKETAKIIMTDNDSANYGVQWDWSKFKYYFASRRVLAAVRWDMPVGKTSGLSAEVLAQFDANGDNTKLHSQYASAQMTFYPLSILQVSGGLIFEMMQNEKKDFNLALGVLAQLKLDIPSKATDWFGFTVKFTTGDSEKTLSGFTPVSSVQQGMIFQETLAGLLLLDANYNIKIIGRLFADLALRYFISTFNNPLYKGNLYGGELWASFEWHPLDDIRLTLGGGVFLPVLGNAYPSGTEVMWKVTACLTISF